MQIQLDELPVVNITKENVPEHIKSIVTSLEQEKWTELVYLYHQVRTFVSINSENLSNEIKNEYITAKSAIINHIYSTLLKVDNYDDYKINLKRLSDILADPKAFWDALHTEVKVKIRVTLRQSQEIAVTFFTPPMLFEFGMQSFLSTDPCDLSKITNEEAAVDVFYECLGFVRASGVDEKYQTHNKDYLRFIEKLLDSFIHVPDFDAHRLVWLIESIKAHLRLPTDLFLSICESLLEKYALHIREKKTIQKLHKLCILSTSPFLHDLDCFKDYINQAFFGLAVENRAFLRRYVYTPFALIVWDGNPTICPSDAICSWALYIENLNRKLQENPELPSLIIRDVFDDSLSMFVSFYGDAQPTKVASAAMRMDIFIIANLVNQYFPKPIPEAVLKKVWYLLYIAAVSGADKEDLFGRHTTEEASDDTSVMLGLETDGCNFVSYSTALTRLNLKFQSESANYDAMCQFIREKY